MITFKTIKAQNFLSIGSTPVEFDLSSTDNTIIYGTNGAGKSTIIDMICYVLFNKVIRDVKLNQLVSSVNKKKMLIELDFNANGIDYKIQRGQKPSIFKLFKNNEQIDQEAATKDLQQQLEQIIGTDFKTFTQTSIMSSTSSAPFMELSTPDRRVVVEKMLDLEVIGKMSITMKERYKEVKFTLEQQNNKIEIIRSKLQSTQEIVDNIQEVSVTQIQQLKNELKLQQTKLTQSVNDLSELYNTPITYPDTPVLPELDLRTELQAPDNIKIQKTEIKIKELGSKMEVCISKANDHKVIAGFYQHNENCDRCKQHISEDFKKDIITNINKKINELSTEYKEYIAQKEILKSDLDKQLEIKSTYNKYLDFVQQERLNHSIICERINDKYKNDCEQINSTHKLKTDMIISEWTNQCNSIKNENVLQNEKLLSVYDHEVNKIMTPYNTEVCNLDQERSSAITRLKSAKYFNETQFDDLSKKLNDLEGKQDNKLEHYKELLLTNKNNLDVITASITDLTEQQELCELGTEMLKDTGLKSKIVRQYLPVINSSINKYLDRMQANYSFVLDEHFNETIKSRHRDIFSYGSFSNGERSRINIAILLMWIDLAKSKNTVSSNILIIDEVLDGALDANGIGYVMEILNEMESVNTFVISHRKEIRHLFDTNIEVQKIGNFSKYNLAE